jgi:shikimate kinase
LPPAPAELPRNVVLTGFMATGKSTVGRALAERLGWRFVDTDEQIVARCGRSVAEIFARDGEAAFRRLEAQIARELAAESGCVIATGGRLMLDPANAAVLGSAGRVFCLQAAPAQIVRRLRQGGPARPLLDVEDPEERVRALLAERAEGYRRFEAITTDGLGVAGVVDELLGRLQGARVPRRE